MCVCVCFFVKALYLQQATSGKENQRLGRTAGTSRLSFLSLAKPEVNLGLRRLRNRVTWAGIFALLSGFLGGWGFAGLFLLFLGGCLMGFWKVFEGFWCLNIGFSVVLWS